MTPVNITEQVVMDIKDYIKSNIASALVDVRTDRDSSVNTEVPKEYFIASQMHAFRTPAIFIIADNVEFNNDQGPNYIDATLKIIVSVVVEEKDLEKLAKKSWRYQDALFKLLNQTTFGNESGAVVKYMFNTRVNNIYFSEDFSFKDEGDSLSVFNKEVALELSVELQQQP